MRRYLVVANQTLGTDALVHFVRTHTEKEPSEFYIVVPATPTLEMVHGAEGVPAVGGGTLLPSSPEHARELAQHRLDKALAQLQEIGVTVEGEVGHRDPVHAVEAVVKGKQFDEIVVSTLPKRLSRWLRQDLPTRLQHKTHLPVTHIGATT